MLYRAPVLVLVGAVLTLAMWAGSGSSDGQRGSSATTSTPDGFDVASVTAFVTTSTAFTPVTTVPSDVTAPTTSAAAAEPAVGPATTAGAPVIPQRGAGTFSYATSGPIGFGEGEADLVFSVGVEDGVGLDVDDVAAFVDATLGDSRSWVGDPTVALRREPSPDAADVRFVVASADTVDSLCAPLRTNGIYSCARNGWIAINLTRWMIATETWTADRDTYRQYVVNHEVGHYLRGPDHAACPGVGLPAPIMMQQTKGLDGCTPNGWPYPDGS